MKRTFVVTALVLLLGSAFVADARPSERERILSACMREFGHTVDSTQNLFEINESFVLQAKFDKRGFLTEFAVRPKYFFNKLHSVWLEPDSFPLLNWSDFEKLVVRLDGLKTKGKLTKKANDIAVVTNSTGYFKESYDHGLLEWGEVGVRGSKENGIRFFTVRYLPPAT